MDRRLSGREAALRAPASGHCARERAIARLVPAPRPAGRAQDPAAARGSRPRRAAPEVIDRMLTRNPWRGVAGLPASVWIVCATTFVNRAGTMVVPFMVLYVTRHLGVRPALAGMALTVYGLGGLVGGPMAGRLCDRLGAFAVLRGALVLSGLILLAFPLASRFGTFLAITFVWSLVAESVRPATMAALTSVVRPEQRKVAVAVNRLGINLGMSVGPAVGGFLATVSVPLPFVLGGGSAPAAGFSRPPLPARPPPP